MSLYTWRERCHGAYRAEAARGLTHEQIIASIQPGASCPWQSDEDEARAAIHADLDARYALDAFNAALRDVPVAGWTDAEGPF